MSDVKRPPEAELDAKEATAEANDSVPRLDPALSMAEGSRRLWDFEGVLTFPPAEGPPSQYPAGDTENNVLWE